MADDTEDMCPECKNEALYCEACGGTKSRSEPSGSKQEERKPKRELPPVPFSITPPFKLVG